MKRPKLIGLSYSPWTEKAVWALDHHAIDYAYEPYSPVFGELKLRRLTRRLRGPVTVPIMIADRQVLSDSYDIARYAEAHGGGAPLFGHPDVDGLVKDAERGLVAARAVGLPRLLDSPGALLDVVPRGIRRRLPKGAAKLGAWGIRRTIKKYCVSARSGDEWEAELRGVLDTIRQRLDAAGGTFVLGQLSFADLALAQVVNLALPAERVGRLKIRPASCAAYTVADRSAEYADLAAWRDALYRDHRKLPESPSHPR